MLYILVIILHMIACFVLIAVILLQSGRGGGLSEMLGGVVQQSQKVFGPQTNVFMTRATSYCAVMFLVTSILLGVMTSHRSRSLMQGAPIQPLFDTSTMPLSEKEAVAPESMVAPETKKAAQSNFQPKKEVE